MSGAELKGVMVGAGFFAAYQAAAMLERERPDFIDIVTGPAC